MRTSCLQHTNDERTTYPSALQCAVPPTRSGHATTLPAPTFLFFDGTHGYEQDDEKREDDAPNDDPEQEPLVQESFTLALVGRRVTACGRR